MSELDRCLKLLLKDASAEEMLSNLLKKNCSTHHALCNPIFFSLSNGGHLKLNLRLITHTENMMGTRNTRVGGEVLNGKNRLLFGYKHIWPSLPLLMHLICHNESLGGKARWVEEVIQGKDEKLGYKLHVADGKNVQGDRGNAVQGKMLQKHSSYPARLNIGSLKI